MAGTETITITSVIEGVDAESLSAMADELTEKMNDVIDLMKRIGDSAVRVELRLSRC